MRSPNTPWGKDFIVVTRNPEPLRKFALELDGKPCTLEEYQAEQRRKALALAQSRRQGR